MPRRVSEIAYDRRLNKIYDLIIVGMTETDIARTIHLSIAQVKRDVRELRDRLKKEAIERKPEEFLASVETAKARMLLNKRRNLQRLNNPNLPEEIRQMVLEHDANLNNYLLRIEWEQELFKARIKLDDNNALKIQGRPELEHSIDITPIPDTEGNDLRSVSNTRPERDWHTDQRKF